MSLPLLQTKLYVPQHQRQRNAIPRPRLTEKLSAALEGKVTLISAPAGFGKSTLISEWIADRHPKTGVDPDAPLALRDRQIPGGVQITWLALDSDDNDPVRFLMYLIASLQKFGTEVGESTWTLLQSPQPPASKTILTLLLNDLHVLVDEDSQFHPVYVLVLEDYHAISAQSIHEIVAFLIDHLPSHMHVILTTRADPPLPFARWRVRGQLSEIRALDLRFSPDEAAAFLNDRMGLLLSADEVLALETRTEGWIAGLQLAALSLQGRPNKVDFLRTFSGSNRYVLNYLVEEVLTQQPRLVQIFLLRTSILERLCGPLCDAIMGAPTAGNEDESPGRLPDHFDSSQSMLEQLQQANLFLAPLDDEGHWYHYHPLFAEALQHRLRALEPETWMRLHHLAGVWFEQQGLLSDAIHHSVRGDDYARTAELIERIWPAAWDQGAVATLIQWVATLPMDNLVSRPGLAISYAWALAFADQSEAAEVCLRHVETRLYVTQVESDPSLPGRNIVLGRIAALRAMMAARRGEAMAAVQLAQGALALMPAASAAVRGNAWYALGLATQQTGELPQALRSYQEATRLGVAAGDAFLMITARYHEARIWVAQGQLHIAADIYRQLLSQGPQHAQENMPVIGLAHVGYAEVLYQWNELAAAAAQIELGLALSPTGSLTYTDGPFYRFLVLARIRQAMGNQSGALAAFQFATETAQRTGIELDAQRATALRALIHLRLGWLDMADLWAQTHADWLAKEADQIAYVHKFELFVFVRVLIAQGRATEALTLLAGRGPAAVATQRTGSIIEIAMLQAQALRLLGQSDAAGYALLQALTLAEPSGYMRIFLDEGSSMQSLLGELESTLSDTHLQRYAARIVAAFDTTYSSRSEDAGEPMQIHDLGLVEPLTDREMDVLRLVAAGLSNAEIAGQLVVTVGTVKTHLKHIFGKLIVQSRTHAVARARSLGIL